MPAVAAIIILMCHIKETCQNQLSLEPFGREKPRPAAPTVARTITLELDQGAQAQAGGQGGVRVVILRPGDQGHGKGRGGG